MVVRMMVLLLLFGLNGWAQEIKIAFSSSTPPYVLPDGKGLFYDIVKESLALKGYHIQPVYTSIARGTQLFGSDHIDAVAISQKNLENTDFDTHYSDEFMHYQNVVVTLDDGIRIDHLSDLTEYDVTAFQGAHKYLGDAFKDIVNNSRERYSEISDQKRQVLKLYKKRTDLLIMDRAIFSYYQHQLASEGKISITKQARFFPIFKPTKYCVAFRDEQIQKDFDEGLRQLRSTGRCEKIYQAYQHRYTELIGQ